MIIKLTSMIRYTIRNYQNLTRKTTACFSTRIAGDFEFHQYDSFTKVLLNRPKALNSLNLDMIKTLNENIPAIDKSKAVWFEGAGGKAFCAGGDVKALYEKDAKVEDRLNFFRAQFSTDYKIAHLKSVQIANWDGIVMGGGFGITSMAPFRIATENSMFAMPEAKLGFFTDICSCYVLSRLRNNIGFYLGMTGARLKGEDLYISGLANYFIQRKDLEAAFNDLKEALPSSSNPKDTVAQVLNKYHSPSNRKELKDEDKIKDLFSIKDFRQIYKKVDNQNDEFSKTVLKNLNEQCPVSVGVVQKLVETAKDKSYRECFLRDYKLVQHFIVDPNFAEGVRTVLVDRGSKANWSHSHILEVKDSDVNKYFEFPSNFQELNV